MRKRHMRAGRCRDCDCETLKEHLEMISKRQELLTETIAICLPLLIVPQSLPQVLRYGIWRSWTEIERCTYYNHQCLSKALSHLTWGYVLAEFRCSDRPRGDKGERGNAIAECTSSLEFVGENPGPTEVECLPRGTWSARKTVTVEEYIFCFSWSSVRCAPIPMGRTDGKRT